MVGGKWAVTDGAIPGLKVADTVKRVEGGVVRATIDRSNLVRVQTPQAFRASTLRAAHATEAEVTDDSAVLEAIGATVPAKQLLGNPPLSTIWPKSTLSGLPK